MKCNVRIVALLFSAASFTLHAQDIPSLQTQHSTPIQSPHGESDYPQAIGSTVLPLTDSQLKKVESGLLIQHLSRKQAQAQQQGLSTTGLTMNVMIYASQYPSLADIAALEQLGARCIPASWIPPLENHPLGFFIAQVPIDKIADVLSLASVEKMDSAEGESLPQNNVAAVAVNATLAWAGGWTGTGVKVGVLDSGLDYTLPKTELPNNLTVRSYAYYPDSISSFVSNTVTEHGTHVTGTVCGKGGYSTSPVLNTGNGGGSYKGMAYGADLVFLKIGNNTTGSASAAAMVAAIKAAADTFFVKAINMSYGGWDAYHDGSNAEAQATDYAYSRGVACFYSAGNEGGSARHYSGTVAANSTTDFIQINVSGAGVNNTALWFNLVWADGAANNNLSMTYYDAAQNPMSNIIQSTTTESPRGTQSKYSHYGFYLPSGNGTYYVRVTNPSAVSQFFHIYDDWGSRVTFASSDPAYTIGSPAHADHAMAVAAYTSRMYWTASDGSIYHFIGGSAVNDIAPFSSRGPRVDGVQKPNIATPGTAIISIRDRDILTSANAQWVDNDGTFGGDANYYVLQGTSMASPVAAGCATLLLQHTPAATPQQVYNAMTQTAVADGNTGVVPNATWGYGKLDVNAALLSAALPVELVSFMSSVRNGSTVLQWRTATETNNFGFEIERKDRAVERINSSMPVSASWMKIGFVPGQGTTNTAHSYAFTDPASATGSSTYRLKQIDKDGRFVYSAEIVSQADALPLRFALSQNYPNPFNPSTSIRFTVAARGRVRLTIFDVLGRETATLLDKTMEPGTYVTEWNAGTFPSGVYFYRLDAETCSLIRKLVIQK